MKKLITIMLAFVILSVSAFAIQDVEWLSNDINLTAAPGNTVSGLVDINNSGNETINVSFSGYTLTSNSNTLELSPIANETNMTPGDEQAITIEAIVATNQIAGNYTGTLTANTGSASDDLAVTVTVTQNTGGFSTSSLTSGTTLPGVTHKANVTVYNSYNTPLIVVMSGNLTDGTNTLSVTEKTLNLAPFESRNVTVDLAVPSNQPAGDYNGNVIFTYDNNTYEDSYTLTVEEKATFNATNANQDLLPGETESVVITLTKTGNMDITNINLTYVKTTLYDNNANKITLSFNPTIVNLTGNTATIVVDIDADSEIDTGSYSTTVTFTGDNGETATSTLSVNIESILRVRNVDLTSDGKDNELKPGETLNIDVKVENIDQDIDLENVFVTVRFLDGSRVLEDDDGDDIEEESDDFDLDADDKETISFTIEMPSEDVDDGDRYTVEITVEGRNTDDRYQTFTVVDTSEEIEFIKETHEISFSELSLSPEAVKCSKRTALDLSVKNIGKKNEDVELVIKNDELGIYVSKNFELDKDPGDSDNKWSNVFYFDLDDNIETGTYPILVEAYYDDNDESIRKSVDLIVGTCAGDNLDNGDDTENNTDSGNNTEDENNFEVITPDNSGTGVMPPDVGGTQIVDESNDNTRIYVLALVVLVLILILLVAYVASYALKNL